MLIYGLLGVVILGAPVAQPGKPLPVEELAARLAELERAHASLETSITVTVFVGRAVERKDDPWTDEDRLYARRYSWLMHDGRLRLEEREEIFGEDGENEVPEAKKQGQVGGRRIGIWDGETWSVHVPGQAELHINRHPWRGPTVDCLGLFNVAPWGSFVGRLPLSEVVRRCRLRTATRDDTLDQYRLDLSPDGRSQIEISVEAGPPLRLHTVALEAFRLTPEKELGARRFRIVYHVDEWDEFDGLLLPKRAYRDGYTDRTGEMGRAVYQRNTARDRSMDPPARDNFEVERYPGLRVYDNCLSLTYEIGTSDILVDGFEYHTVEPLTEDVARRLPFILDSTMAATAIKPTSVSTSERFAVDRLGRTVTFSVVGFFLALALIGTARWVGSGRAIK